MSSFEFTKMHGAGNDYVYVNCFEDTPDDPSAIAVRISDRHFGIGSDGLVLVLPPETADADLRMRMFNADGSEAEMCGNAVRCVAKYARDRELARNNPVRVETGDGIKRIRTISGESGVVHAAVVDMGEPRLAAEEIPVTLPGADGAARVVDVPIVGTLSVDFSGGWVDAAGVIDRVTCVSMGNPHAVFFCDRVEPIPLERIGPALETDSAFPRKINVHFVQVDGRGEVTMRTWERGSGITLACGTGASAVCVAGALTDRTDRVVLVHLPGGDLTIEWRADDNHVFMTGETVEVFSGWWLGDRA